MLNFVHGTCYGTLPAILRTADKKGQIFFNTKLRSQYLNRNLFIVPNLYWVCISRNRDFLNILNICFEHNLNKYINVKYLSDNKWIKYQNNCLFLEAKGKSCQLRFPFSEV